MTGPVVICQRLHHNLDRAQQDLDSADISRNHTQQTGSKQATAFFFFLLKDVATAILK